MKVVIRGAAYRDLDPVPFERHRQIDDDRRPRRERASRDATAAYALD
jgi:hypothetical protein